MHSRFTYLLVISMASLIAACSGSFPFGQGSRIDEVPMYGGMDRSKVPSLKQADETFISEVTAKYGTRQAASTAWVEQGFRFYQQDDLGIAMRRFNQAWLLNPDNPEVYTGFAAVLSDQGKFCEGQKLLDTGLSKGTFQDGFLPDAALIYSMCTVANRSLSVETRQSMLRSSDDLFRKAYSSAAVGKPYVLQQWVKALYFREDYAGAWAKALEYRKVTGRDVDAPLLRELRAKMPEPRS